MRTYPFLADLFKKYDVPVPRYTSYPTVPYWNSSGFTVEKWIEAVKKAFTETNEEKGVSLYIHLPFCESLCTYCACNTHITKNHSVEMEYIRSLLAEWRRYLGIFGTRPMIRELHVGGGTPTFFSPDNLHRLITGIIGDTTLAPVHDFSFEGHPNNTTSEHLKTLAELGFNRVSFGVQDLDLKVQQTVHRIQPFENVAKVTALARSFGYKSVSFDLMYGLPFQTTVSVTTTVEKVLSLRPDRISFYSYAHVPWMKPGQRGYESADLPAELQKRILYEAGKVLFSEAGYHEIGMDHFALPHDDLYLAQSTGKLHRNFMGYTTSKTDLLIGLGASAIGDAKYAYAQNVKKVDAYNKALGEPGLPLARGHCHSAEDRLVRDIILAISCRQEIPKAIIGQIADKAIQSALEIMCGEGILTDNGEAIRVTGKGKAFIRNICAVFDLKMAQAPVTGKAFSNAI